MDASTAPTRLERFAAILRKHGVEFAVIGGEAAAIHGSPLPTFDTDLCYRRTDANLERLALALKELHVSLRGAPPGLPFIIDKRTLQNGCNFTFSSPLGDLDLLGHIEPLGDYEATANRCESVHTPDGPLLVISLDDLIRIKQHLRVPKTKLRSHNSARSAISIAHAKPDHLSFLRPSTPGRYSSIQSSCSSAPATALARAASPSTTPIRVPFRRNPPRSPRESTKQQEKSPCRRDPRSRCSRS